MSRSKDRWVPLREANLVHRLTPSEIRDNALLLGCSEEEAREQLEEEARNARYFVNDVYQVALRNVSKGWVQLNIRRRDGKPIFRDWRHFQRIKNELVGPECEGIELYPAESRKVDTGNKYHLWCVTDPAFRFPLGFQERDVIAHDLKRPGLRQRADSIETTSPDEPGR